MSYQGLGESEPATTDAAGNYELKTLTILYEVSFPGTSYPTQNLGSATRSPANILVKTK